jgi:hypothetical protein
MFLSATDTIITEGFLLVSTLFFALGCWILTAGVRRIVETAVPRLKDKGPVYKSRLAEWWREVILFMMPAVIGIAGALPLRDVEVAGTRIIPVLFSSWQGAILYGLVIGFFCSLIYKAFKKMFFSKLGVKSEKELPKADIPKPPGDEDTKDEMLEEKRVLKEKRELLAAKKEPPEDEEKPDE